MTKLKMSARKLKLVRRASEGAKEKYTIGGRLKDGKTAPRPITLAKVGPKT